MITYPSTLPCASLSSNSNSYASINQVVEFDFTNRVRLQSRVLPTASYTFILDNITQVNEWINFYDVLINDGTDEFFASFPYMGQVDAQKFRFKSPYSVSQLSTDIYSISAVLELTAYVAGHDAPAGCPKTPSETLFPSDTLLPC